MSIDLGLEEASMRQERIQIEDRFGHGQLVYTSYPVVP